jgi:hypothetical protein
MKIPSSKELFNCYRDFDNTGIILLLFGTALNIVGIFSDSNHISNISTGHQINGYILWGTIFCVCSIPFQYIGNIKLHKAIEDYNLKRNQY